MIKKLEHIGVMVSDMEASIRFYTETLGLALVGRERLDNGVELVFLSFPGQEDIQLELVGRGGGFEENGKVNHIAFTVDDIDTEVRRLKESGVRMIDEEPKTILGGVRIAFFYGPDGERLELFQPKSR
ncbi:lactoylglutathione lyase [Paenibacillus sp. J31TS4]|uniref:VOC family protein n=1 Tax=Paenibacillus sp. J31TS4 TaxID=2807195 RepID=UPI001B1D29CF|nr:VOC family protein [Paenibacillus sp. J31TS4]GIP41162.1 lactoylglutathione lyase [Paenibacillus sp. J31TS4]